MNSILKELNDKISSNPYFLGTEGKLLREKVKSEVLNLDDELLKILLEDECLRKAFFNLHLVNRGRKGITVGLSSHNP